MTHRFLAPLLIALFAGCSDGDVRHDENAPDPSVATYGAGLVPQRPTGLTPAGNTPNATPNFVWTVVDGESTQFQLWIDGPNGRDLTAGALFTAVQAGCAAGGFPRTCTLPAPITLQGGIGRWWVRGRHPVDGFGPWSATVNFNITCGVPTLLSPTGVITDSTPPFVWTPVNNVSNYRLFVQDTGANPRIDQVLTPAGAGCPGGVGGPNCTFTSATAVVGGNVTFWVQTCGQSFSTPLTFFYDDTCPGGCDDGNLCTTDTCVGGVCMNVDNNIACDDTNACTVGDVCQNGACFATDQNNCRPAPIGPTGPGIGYAPTFQWNEVVPAVATYRLWVDDCSGLQAINEIYNAATICAGGVCSVNTEADGVTPLEVANGQVRWWVQSPPHTDGELGPPFLHHGPWSATNNASNGIDTAVTTISPAGIIATNQPTFTWNALPGQGHSYQLYVRDALGTNLTANTDEVAAGCPNGAGVCSLAPGFTLPTGASSFWVKANYECMGSNLWSTTRNFSVP